MTDNNSDASAQMRDNLRGAPSHIFSVLECLLAGLLNHNNQFESLGATQEQVCVLNQKLVEYAKLVAEATSPQAHAQVNSLGNSQTAPASPLVAEAVADSVK